MLSDAFFGLLLNIFLKKISVLWLSIPNTSLIIALTWVNNMLVLMEQLHTDIDLHKSNKFY